MREVRVHRDGEGRLSSPAALPHAAGVARGFLRVAGRAAGPGRAGGRTTGPRDRGDPRGEPAAVWQPADSRRADGLRSGHAPGNWGRDADRRPQRFTDADAPPEMPLAESRTRSADRWPETGFLGAARAVERAVPLTDE